MITKKLANEPKALREVHIIRENLSKLPKRELDSRLAVIRKKYKQILVCS